MPCGIDEGQDFRDRRICRPEVSHLVQTIGKDARAVKQLLIKRFYRRKAFERELAAFHADDVEARKTGVLATGKTKRNHVSTHTA